ncbi:MAG: lysophospholipid acyltransferase family protein [Bacteroidales bacterium]|nr:lysophospholipid acyltransferase family protein [Bacteroidales bacterium]
MLTRILFYLIFYPISVLPLSILYIIAFPFYLILAFVIRYRRKVIDANFIKSFPNLSKKEIRRLRNRYYWHLTQLGIEMLKMISMSKKNVMRRYHCSNPELVNKFFDEGKSVVLMSSHYNNWEWMVLSLDMQFKPHGIGVGAHNTNKVFEKLINRARTRYGTEVVFHDNVREVMAYHENNNIPAAYMILSDQNPSNPKRCYVAEFLNQKTGFIRGSEGFARKYDIPVLYYKVIKEKLGRYRIDVEVITEHPNELPDGAIMQRYTELLEGTIKSEIPFWLWSHRRWKHNFDDAPLGNQ